MIKGLLYVIALPISIWAIDSLNITNVFCLIKPPSLIQTIQ